jgi:hypothetical protein
MADLGLMGAQNVPMTAAAHRTTLTGPGAGRTCVTRDITNLTRNRAVKGP